jgi:hypothetical protein
VVGCVFLASLAGDVIGCVESYDLIDQKLEARPGLQLLRRDPDWYGYWMWDRSGPCCGRYTRIEDWYDRFETGLPSCVALGARFRRAAAVPSAIASLRQTGLSIGIELPSGVVRYIILLAQYF